jgi:hypothetical protein
MHGKWGSIIEKCRFAKDKLEFYPGSCCREGRHLIRSCKDQSNQGDANTNINYYRFTPLYEDGKSAWEIQPKSSRVLAAFTGTHEQQESMGIWGAAQEEAFEKIKEELFKPTVVPA